MNMVDTLFKTEASNDEELYCVYMHINKINGKRYIGQTMNLKNRWRPNGYGYKSSPHFYNAIKKYGWDNFDHYIIQKNLTKEEADKLEDLNIVAYNTMNNKFGYNTRRGGNKGTFSEYSKQKLSKAQMGHIVTQETREKLSKINKGRFIGRPISEEQKKKISIANSGSKNGMYGKFGKDNPTSISVVQYDLNGNVLNEFGGIAEASRVLNIERKYISKCCNGQQILVENKYIFRHKGEPFDKYRTTHNKCGRKCKNVSVIKGVVDYE